MVALANRHMHMLPQRRRECPWQTRWSSLLLRMCSDPIECVLLLLGVASARGKRAGHRHDRHLDLRCPRCQFFRGRGPRSFPDLCPVRFYNVSGDIFLSNCCIALLYDDIWTLR